LRIPEVGLTVFHAEDEMNHHAGKRLRHVDMLKDAVRIVPPFQGWHSRGTGDPGRCPRAGLWCPVGACPQRHDGGGDPPSGSGLITNKTVPPTLSLRVPLVASPSPPFVPANPLR